MGDNDNKDPLKEAAPASTFSSAKQPQDRAPDVPVNDLPTLESPGDAYNDHHCPTLRGRAPHGPIDVSPSRSMR